MTTSNPLPSLLTAAVVEELLDTDIHAAHAATVQRCPAGWRALSPAEQFKLAVLGIPILYIPNFHLSYANQEQSMPAAETHSEPCFSRTSVERIRAEFGPDEAVTDAELDAAADEATALTRPAAGYVPRYTPTSGPRPHVLRVVAGIVLAACVLGWALIEVVL